MNLTKAIQLLIVAAIGILLITTAMIPVLSDIPGESTEETNEGASLINLTKLTGSAEATVTYTGGYNSETDALEIYVTNGTDRQDITDSGVGFLYADNNMCLIIQQTRVMIVALKESTPVMEELSVPTVITKTASGVTVASETTAFSYSFPAPEWAYMPLSTGKFSSYLADTEVRTDNNFTKAFYGINNTARTVCYNGMDSSGAETTFREDYTDGVLSGGDWTTDTDPAVVTDVMTFVAPNTYMAEGSGTSPTAALLAVIPLLCLVGIVVIIIQSIRSKEL